jgi:hypothetical protein
MGVAMVVLGMGVRPVVRVGVNGAVTVAVPLTS